MSLSPLLFMATYFGGLLVTAISWPVAAFLTYQMVYLVSPGRRWWINAIPDLSWSMYTTIALMLCAMISVARSAEPRLRAAPPWKWLLATLLLNVAITPLAVSSADHNKILGEFLKLGVVVICSYRLLTTHKGLLASIWVYLAGVAYIGAVARSVGRRSGGRVEGIGPIDSPDANGTAALMVPAVSIVLVMFCTGGIRTKIAAALLGAFTVNGLVLLNSRGAFLGVIVSGAIAVYFLLYSSMQAGRQRLSAVLSVLIGFGGAVYLADDAFWDRMNTLRSIEDDPEGGANRLVFWKATFDIVAERPFGGGARAFQNLSARYIDEYYLAGGSGKAVHSTWFQTFVETGWIGIFLLVGMCASCLRCVRCALDANQTRGDADGYWLSLAIGTGFVGYLVSASFIDRYRAEVLYWLVMYCMVTHSVYVQPRGNLRRLNGS